VFDVEEHLEERRVVGTMEAAGDVSLRRSLVGAVSAHNVRIEQGLGGPMMLSGDVTVTNGGCGPVMCSGDVTITNGGTQSVIAGEAHVGRGAFVGAVVGAKVTVEEGARVLMTTAQAAAFGAAVGAVVGLLALRRRG
jgi:hypothetical protein